MDYETSIAMHVAENRILETHSYNSTHSLFRPLVGFDLAFAETGSQATGAFL
jgi:hypothetical protein